MSKPEIAVVMSTYSRNHGDKSCDNLLKRSVDSILAQKFTNFELLLVDDGSTDGSEKVCREYADKDARVKYHRFNDNSGRPAIRYNDGMYFSDAPYITFMFDDDKWYPNALTDLHNAITGKYKDHAMVYGLVNYMNVETGKPLQMNFGAEWSWEKINNGNFLCNNSVIVKRDVINDVGGYDEDPVMRRLCDWDLWWRIGKKYKVKRIMNLLGEVHAFHPDSIGKTVELDLPAIKALQSKEDRMIRLKGELKKKYLNITFVHHGHDSALQRWRIWYLSEALVRAGHSTSVMHLSHKSFKTIALSSDVVVYYRCYSEQRSMINELKASGKLVVYDIDDFVFQKGGKYNGDQERDMIYNYLNHVNCYMASTPKLLDQMPKNKNPRFIRENAIDEDTYNILSKEIAHKKASNIFRIGWLAGINRSEMHKFMIDLLIILDRQNIKLDFWYFGKVNDFYHTVNKFKNINIRRLGYVDTSQWKDLYNQFNLSQFDVVINPLEENDLFLNCKSHLKFLESAALGVPLVVSRVSPFKEILTEDEHALFASSPQEYVDKILFVKNNPVDAVKVVENARKLLKEKYFSDDVAQGFINNCRKSMRIASTNKDLFSPENTYVPDIIQDRFGYVTGEILSPIVHEFICTRPGLCRVEYLGSNFGKHSNCPIRLVIKNKDLNSIVMDRIYNAKDFKDHSWWGFEFTPIVDSLNITMEVSFIPLVPTPENSIQFYFNYLDLEYSGEFFINGIKNKGSLAFKSYCVQEMGSLPSEKKPVMKPHGDQGLMANPSKHEEKIRALITVNGSFGDVILVTPIIKYLNQMHNYDIFVETNHGSILANNPDVAGTIKCGDKIPRIGKRFNLSNVHEMNPRTHIVDSFCRSVFGHSLINKDMLLYPHQDDISIVDELSKEHDLVDGQYVVFHAGLTSKNRTIPKGTWARLEAHCASQRLKVVFVGSGSDFEPVMPKTVNLVNKVTVLQVKYLIDKAKSFVGIDGDYMKVAGATDTKIIGIFTATDPKFRIPYRKDIVGWNTSSVCATTQCFGCWHNQSIPINYHGCDRADFVCFNSITPKMILERINQE